MGFAWWQWYCNKTQHKNTHIIKSVSFAVIFTVIIANPGCSQAKPYARRHLYIYVILTLYSMSLKCWRFFSRCRMSLQRDIISHLNIFSSSLECYPYVTGFEGEVAFRQSCVWVYPNRSYLEGHQRNYFNFRH
jgi:hypothetical protein